MVTKTSETGRADEPHQGAPLPRETPLVSYGLASTRHVPGGGGPMRWFFSSIWLAYLIQPVSALFGHRHAALWIAGGVVLTIAFCVIYIAVIMSVDRWPRLVQAGLVVLAVLSAVASVVYGRGWTTLWIYVSCAAGMILVSTGGRRVALFAIVAIAALYSLFSWISHLSLPDWGAELFPVLLVGLAMIGFRMQMVLMRELAQARSAVAKLAMNDERLRLARDMHDLTGQSLSMITLKSELAAKRLTRLPPSAERDAVLGELGDIGHVSRQTLHDIRDAVSGYRRPTLAVEVITARHALDAAGIRLDDAPELTLRSGEFAPDTEAVLAWCLREGVTNVIRHSGASSCQVRLAQHGGELSLEVTDNGHGLTAGDQTASKSGPVRTGSGLRGMSERLSSAGGSLSLGPADPARPGHGFRLTARVPQAPAATGHNCP